MKYKLLTFFTFLLFITSCKKSGSSTQADVFITLTANSSWTYQQTNSAGTSPVITNYTVTSTNKDTSINSRSYHIFNNTAGTKQYSNISGNDYYQFDTIPLPNAGAIERLYLKDNISAGSNWTQNVSVTIPGFPLAVPIVLTNTITEKGISRTVNNIAYSDVIHVQTSISSTLIPATSLTSSINTYYAKKFGMIENTSVVALNYLGFIQNVNVKVVLMSADLK